MNKKYSLVLSLLLCFVFSESGHGCESFCKFSTITDDYNNYLISYYHTKRSIAFDTNLLPKVFSKMDGNDNTTPEIKVRGNLGSFPTITNGSTTPQGTNATLFLAQYMGASQSKSYRIHNEGSSNLTLSTVSIIGANPNDFTITVHPDNAILPGNFSLLEITFSPLAAGARHATISILNNDSNNDPFTFAIKGTGLCVAATNTINPSKGPTGTIVTIIGSNFDAFTTVSINGVSMAKTIISAAMMEAEVPKGASSGNIIVVNGIGCTSNIPFTVIDNQISGCEGSSSLSDLFISEVTDATFGGLNYIEIYNGTGTTIELEDYAIGIYYNGEGTPRHSIQFTAIALPNNSTYILAIGYGNSTCPQLGGNGQLANQKSTVAGINKKDDEHDMIRLLKADGSVVVDEFGTYMNTIWMDETIVTGDRGFNFRRKNTATLLPNPTFNLSDWDVIDWVGSGAVSCSTNDYSNIGFYDYSGGASPVVALQPIAPSSGCDLMPQLTILGIENGLPLSYQWFYNAPETSNWVEILNTNPEYSGQQSSDLKILSSLNLNQYQYYAQISEGSSTCYKASEAIQLHIQKTAWNGVTWNPNPPDKNTIVILDGNYTTSPLTGSFSACNLVVNSGYSLNISNNYYVEISNNVVVNGTSVDNFGAIIVETNGTFVQHGDDDKAGTFSLNNTAKARVNKRTAIKQKWYDYTYWGSPVTAETIEAALNIASPTRRFYFESRNYEDTDGDDVDDNGDDWQIASGRMIPGVGYASTSNGSLSFPRVDITEFNGAFNTGNVQVPIYTNSLPTDKDWNFLGNPYPCAIDFKLLHTANSQVIDGAAYLWSQASPPLASNPGNQALNFNGADYAIISVGSGNIAGGTKEIPSDYIPSGQGFFVIGINDGGIMTFKNSMRMADNTSNSQFFRNNSDTIPNKFWINLTSDNGIFNQILVAYVDGATDGFDGSAYDAERNGASGLKAMLYTQIPGKLKKYAIQGKAKNSLNLDEEVSLGFHTAIAQPTIYALSVAQIQGAFFEENVLFLNDNLFGTYHNLSASDYQFTSLTGDFKDRFTMVFKNKTLSIINDNLHPKGLSILELDNGQVQFSIAEQQTITSIEIMDLFGRKLYSLNGNKATEVCDLSNLSQTVYIASVKLSNGQTLTKRALKRF